MISPDEGWVPAALLCGNTSSDPQIAGCFSSLGLSSHTTFSVRFPRLLLSLPPYAFLYSTHHHLELPFDLFVQHLS